jgi:hypothetical protein
LPRSATSASAEVSPRCFARFRALRERVSGAITLETDDLLRGAESYARPNFADAANAWRPLLRGSGPLVTVLPDAMADVFDHVGAPELAETVDQAVMLGHGEFHGATLAHVRAARRARKRDDRKRACALAKQVIAAWGVADASVLAAAEMRGLLHALASRDPDCH